MSTALDTLRTGTDLDAMIFPPLRWAVPGLIPEGWGLFTGPPKAGKSWATLGVALAVASGGRAFGVIDTGRPRPVLLMALEDGERRLQDRCWTLLPGQALPALLHYRTSTPAADVVPLIKAFLVEYAAAQPLAILDTLGRVMPNALPGESAYSRDYRIGAALKGAADDVPGATLAVVHHVRKAAGADWMDSTSGTNGLNGSADWTLNLARERNSDRGILRVTGRDVPEAEYAVTIDGGSWRLDGATLRDAARTAVTVGASLGLGERSTAIVAYLGEHPHTGPTAIGNALGISPNAAGARLNELEVAGRIVRTGRGLYALKTPPRETRETRETN